MIMSKKTSAAAVGCPCGLPASYENCCGRYIDPPQQPAPTAEALMRSRYVAYTRQQEAYLLATWHASTRPAALDLAQDPVKWLGLQVVRCQDGQINDTQGVVQFVARYKVNGRACRLQETSRFVREEGHWYYLDGDIAD